MSNVVNGLPTSVEMGVRGKLTETDVDGSDEPFTESISSVISSSFVFSYVPVLVIVCRFMLLKAMLIDASNFAKEVRSRLSITDDVSKNALNELEDSWW